MGEDFAHAVDLQKHWPSLTADQFEDATQKLHEASIEIRALYPDVDRRIASGALGPDVPKLVVCRMVKRAMEAPADGMTGVSSATAQTGPFSQTLSFTNPDGAVYLTKADKRLLAGRSGRAFTIHPRR